MKFSDVLDIRNGRNQRSVESKDGKYPIYGSGGIIGRANDFICDAGTVVIGRKGNINTPIFVNEPFWNVDTAFGLVANRDVILPKYLFYFCINFDFERLNTTVTIPSLTKANLLQVEISVPHMDKQQYVVNLLDTVFRLIDLRQQELQNLDNLVKSRFIELFDGVFEEVSAEDVCSEIVDCPHSTPKYDESELIYPAIRTSEIQNGSISWDSMKYVGIIEYEKRTKRLKPEKGDIVYAREGTYGDCVILPDEYEFCLGQRTMLFRPDYRICTSAYLHAALRSAAVKKQADESNAGSTVPHVNVADAKKFFFPLPPMELQQKFAAFVARVDISKLAVQKSLEELETLKKSLMQEYFG